ncbi:MAG: GNAT family N-acetyltransferase [Proteobacteria bacterium]|nr:GNAT family N-acetyltransferase [Pseudomonadota bacterium]MBU1648668.1 GNAT family N-acetyltransferase [Pseudomonadota bacterium]
MSEQIFPEISELRSLFVIPQYSRQGVARSLLQRAENEALQRGYEKSLALYQDHGDESDAMIRLLTTTGIPLLNSVLWFVKAVSWGKSSKHLFSKNPFLPLSVRYFCGRICLPDGKRSHQRATKTEPLVRGKPLSLQ